MDDIANIVLFHVTPLLIATVLHEISHGLAALALGDDTARKAGRLLLHTHFDLYGSLIIPLLLYAAGSPVLVGYAKPVPINPRKFKHPETDLALTALAGPVCNVLLALVGAFILNNCEIGSAPVDHFIFNFIVINLALFLLNMLPIPPLDGSKVLAAILPPRLADRMCSSDSTGFFILIVIEIVCSRISESLGYRVGVLAVLERILRGIIKMILP